MRILVIADTHIPLATDKIPSLIETEAKASDYCLHCGDFITYEVYQTLNSWTKTYGVCGNMDDSMVCSKFPARQIIEFGEVTLGLIHGEGSPFNLINYINKAFSDEFSRINIFVFGHSHKPLDTVIQNKIYFNPGSLTDKIFAAYNSYGLLEIDGKKIERRIVKIG